MPEITEIIKGGVPVAIAFMSGGGLGTIIAHFLNRNKHIDEGVFNKRSKCYSNLLGAIRVMRRGDLGQQKTHDLINEALLLTSNQETKDILRKIGNDLIKGKRRDNNLKNSRRLRRLESLLQKEIGIRSSSLQNLFYRLTGRRFKDLDRNDICICGSGKKYKKCHGA